MTGAGGSGGVAGAGGTGGGAGGFAGGVGGTGGTVAGGTAGRGGESSGTGGSGAAGAGIGGAGGASGAVPLDGGSKIGSGSGGGCACEIGASNGSGEPLGAVGLACALAFTLRRRRPLRRALCGAVRPRRGRCASFQLLHVRVVTVVVKRRHAAHGACTPEGQVLAPAGSRVRTPSSTNPTPACRQRSDATSTSPKPSAFASTPTAVPLPSFRRRWVRSHARGSPTSRH